MVKVKICGITNLQDALLTSEFGADALGFIFYQKSQRYVKPSIVKSIVESLPPFVTTIGVFVNAPLTEITRVLESVPLKLIQLHGDESPEYCQQIPVPVLKVFRIKNGFDCNLMTKYKTTGYLLDTHQKQSYGGTGATFDWKIAKEAKAYGSIWLSGGLNANNVSEAIDFVQPYAVDVCSGVEARPGKKDPVKMKAFFHAVAEVAPLTDS